MLVETAKQVDKRVHSLSYILKNQKEIERFDDRLNILSDISEDVKDIYSLDFVLRSEGIEVEYKLEQLNYLYDKVEGLRDNFESDPKHIIDTDISDLRRSIKSFVESASQRLESAWRAHFQSEVEDISIAILNVLGQLGRFDDLVADIKNLTRSLSKWENRPPKTEEELNDFRVSAQRRQEAWRKLRAACSAGSGDESTEVMTFLLAAGTDGAQLNQLTESVQKWLEKEDLLDSLCIRLTG